MIDKIPLTHGISPMLDSEVKAGTQIKSENSFPLIVQASSNQDIDTLKKQIKHCQTQFLGKTAAVLFRGYYLKPLDLEPLIRSISPGLMEYDYASTPRKRVEGRIFTSTEYPSSRNIPLHSEMAYTTNWPSILWFYCDIAPETGGETPLADNRKVYSRIPKEITERFTEKGVMYTRTYNTGLDIPWEQVFGTENRQLVERYCRGSGISFEWQNDNILKTHQICQAVTQHPCTKEMVWFNQAHLFHISALDPDTRENLLISVDEDQLPRNAYYGDGTPIEDQVLDEIRGIYNELQVTFPWKQGDLLMVDNLLASHGRKSYSKNRRILVAMTS